MNKTEATNKFTREYATKLATSSTTSLIVKKMRQAFFEKHNLDSGARFSNKHVAESLTLLYIKAKKGITLESLISDFKNIPFLLEELTEEDIEIIYMKVRPEVPSLLKPDDLAKLQQDEYLAEIEDKFEDKARIDAEKILSEQLSEMELLKHDLTKEKEELKKFKSELDSLAPTIELEKDIDTPEPLKEESKWWQDLGLESNPYVSDRGLVGIPKEKWDDIFVETHFFKTQLRGALTHPEEILFKTKLILGEYGSGKTTLINVLSNRLGAIGILPINITINPSPNIGGLTNEVIQLIGNDICNYLSTTHRVDPRREIGYIDSQPKLGMVLDIGLSKGMSNKIVLFIDGLHKGNKYLPETFEFIQQLQNIHEFIENKGFMVGIILAGDLRWEREIENIPSLSGSIFNIEIIPPIREDDAVEAVIRRILGFTNPGVTPPTIRKEPLRQAFQVLSERYPAGLTFRIYLNHVMSRLSRRAYDEVGISIELHWESVAWVHDYVLKSNFNDNYASLIKIVMPYKKTKEKLKQLLPEIYVFGGISEDEQIFMKNRPLFALLRKHNFIVQRKSAKKGPFVWAISPELVSVLDESYRKSKLIPSEVLSIFFEERDVVADEEVKSIYGPIIDLYKTASQSWFDSWPELSVILDNIKAILQSIENTMLKEKKIDINVDHIKNSVELALKAVILVSDSSKFDNKDVLLTFENIWAVPENSSDIIAMYSVDEIPKNKMQLFGLLNQHVELIKQLYDLISEISKGETFCRMSNRLLTEDDLQEIHRGRIYLINNSFKESIEVACAVLEDKIRDVVYYLLRAAWGEKAFENIPPDICKNILRVESRGHPRAKRGRDPNYLFDVSRSEYSKIMFNNNTYKCIFGESLKDYEKKELQNIIELAFSLGDREAHRDRPKYFREHATEIADVIRFLPKICEILNSRILYILTNEKFSLEKD
ncbi:MAG: hypothetical protein FP824_04190, partial [Euryarchaeota archaeon]|nr:hypothetical protein [Euryarchaeota archaeon]